MPETTEFNAIRISLASPDQIRQWSYGEVIKPETINYRTLKPEKDGLFCERIFGPTKDFECYCGKYKRIRYKGIKCDRCGVEVARAKVRRERMGHIELAAPVAHIWFAKGIPSRLGLLLDLSPRSLERVLYFAQYIVISVDAEARGKLMEQTQQDAQKTIDEKEATIQAKHAQIEEKIAPKAQPIQKQIEDIEKAVRAEADKRKAKLEEEAAALDKSLQSKMGKKAAEPVQFNGATVVKKGDTVAQRHLKSLGDVLARALKEAEAQAKERVRVDTEAPQAKIQELRQAALQDVQTELDTLDEEKGRLHEDLQTRLDELEELRPLQLYTENRYRDLKQKYGDVFTCGMGAEAILEILKGVDLEKLRSELYEEIRSTSGQRRKKATKRLRVVEALRKSTNKPEWMILKVLPVLPPELRPMVQLDGGRFATSDLNDLYRRVINRNNRLRRLLELGAPEIIVRNEKRMLQESVDALIDNGRRGRAISGSHNHKLKSLSDMLRGKQGRFRQNLLGKRVDYSGRSVIVVGPELRLGQCGLPKRMALELFKPFVIHRLVAKGMAHNIKSAKRMVERSKPEVWDVLEEAIKDRVVMLNRAPTLHRLGIQAFEPVLIEGSAIQLHPLVCTAFNADFDGDQMAVHVPLSFAAVMEAKKIMLSTNNMLSPASGEPLVAPTLDMVLGCYYLTMERQGGAGEGMVFGNFQEARLAHDLGLVDLHAKVRVRVGHNGTSHFLDTTVGRMIFNETLPESMRFRNQLMDKKSLKELVAECYHKMGNDVTADVLDKVKRTGFRYATQSGITIGIADLEVPAKKKQVLAKADAEILGTDKQFERGLITEDERYNAAVQIWTRCSEEMEVIVKEELPKYGGIYLMAISGAKGNIAQIKQMAGMRGLMSDPRGRIIDLPIRASFREGLSVLEYFISTHGARKGLADTALRTADSGYLTRRLIDVAQDMIVMEDDCGTEAGLWIDDQPDRPLVSPMAERVLGRMAARPFADPKTGEVIVDRNELIEEEKIKTILESLRTYRVGRLKAAGATADQSEQESKTWVTAVKYLMEKKRFDVEKARQHIGVDKHRMCVRSALYCDARRGICKACYGRSLARGLMPQKGEAMGIIAAQSIGEPGTQLTLRTFHTGGVAGLDITSGLPRVEELFEARTPKSSAVIAEIEGAVDIEQMSDGRRIQILNTETFRHVHDLPAGYEVVVKNGDVVEVGTPLALLSGDSKPSRKGGKAGAKQAAEGKQAETALAPTVTAQVAGKVEIKARTLAVVYEEREEREYMVPLTARVLVAKGAHVKAGDQLTEGLLNPQDVLRIMGREAVQQYLVDEVQKVYRSQGVAINDKHMEIMVRQMLRKVRIDNPGDTDLLPGELVDRFIFQDINARVLAEGGEPATAQEVLLGITKASLSTDSFLAAASFQETARVLTEAALKGSVDRLMGLKENVIIGRLIPARLASLEEEVKQHLAERQKAFLGALAEPVESLNPADVARLMGDEPPAVGAAPEGFHAEGDAAEADAAEPEKADAGEAESGPEDGTEEKADTGK